MECEIFRIHLKNLSDHLSVLFNFNLRGCTFNISRFGRKKWLIQEIPRPFKKSQQNFAFSEIIWNYSTWFKRIILLTIRERKSDGKIQTILILLESALMGFRAQYNLSSRKMFAIPWFWVVTFMPCYISAMWRQNHNLLNFQSKLWFTLTKTN